MKDILKMIFMCMIIAIFFLTLVDLLASEPQKLDLIDFSKQIDFILKVNSEVSVDDIVTISDAFVDSFKRTGLTKFEFMAICAWESRFKKKAVGRVNPADRGICQINYNTWKYFKKKGYISGEWKDIHDIQYNICVASVVLMRHKQHLKKIFPKKSKKELDKLLIESYNKGIGGVKKIVKNKGKLKYYRHVMKMMED